MVFKVDGISKKALMRLHDQLNLELVLVSKTNKELLRTVLLRKERSLSSPTNFVEGKGKGNIFLLYGGPGTGKTLTVECVANDTHRPLIRITAQDVRLGEQIEWTLQTWFSLAAKWDAILLIDETDLFLEQRRAGDLKRNSLSTVFLRTMEYYQEVLFLTTNRLGHIDDSFISRITCPIYYPTLTPDTKNRIIRKLVKRFEETDDIIIEEAATAYLVNECQKLNGCELRNVLQNAVAAGESDLRVLRNQKIKAGHAESRNLIQVRIRHVKAAVERQTQFQDYLERLRGGRDLDTRARSKQDWL